MYTPRQISDYIRQGYFGGKARKDKGVVKGIKYWEPSEIQLEKYEKKRAKNIGK